MAFFCRRQAANSVAAGFVSGGPGGKNGKAPFPWGQIYGKVYLSVNSYPCVDNPILPENLRHFNTFGGNFFGEKGVTEKYTFAQIFKEAIGLKGHENGPVTANSEAKDYLQALAEKVLSDISAHYPDRYGELVGMFVTSLTSRHAELERKADWKRKQAEGIQAAKVRGPRFGRPPKPLPEGFHGAYLRWRTGEISSTKAAAECGMPEPTFRYRAERYQEAAS